MSRVAITGSGGQLGRHLVDAFKAAGDEVIPLGRMELDLDEPRAGASLLADARPQVIVNAAAWTDVDGSARDPDAAMRRNGTAPGYLATATVAWRPLFVQISTNEVFDGVESSPYGEEAVPNPRNAYGAAKLAGERAVADATPNYLIVRTAWLFGPGGRNFVSRILAAADAAKSRGEPVRVVDDEWGNPTWAPFLARAIIDVLDRGTDERVLHLAGSPATTRFAWAEIALHEAGDPRLQPIRSADYQRASRVPLHAVLSTALARRLGIAPIEWQSATMAYARTLRLRGAPG